MLEYTASPNRVIADMDGLIVMRKRRYAFLEWWQDADGPDYIKQLWELNDN
jgi:hypothetical protein